MVKDKIDYKTGSLGSMETDGTATDEKRMAFRGQHVIRFDKDSSFEDIMKATRVYMQGLVAHPLPEPSHLTGAPLRPYLKAEEDLLKEFFGGKYDWSNISEDGLILLMEKGEKKQVGSFVVYHKDVTELLRQRKLAKTLNK